MQLGGREGRVRKKDFASALPLARSSLHMVEEDPEGGRGKMRNPRNLVMKLC